MPVTVASDRRFRRSQVKPARQRRSWLSRLWLVLRVGTTAGVLVGVAYGVSHGITNARVLPSTVEVAIRERRPMALARLGSTLYLVDEGGLVIDEYGPNYAQLDLPILDGLGTNAGTGDPSVEPARAGLAARVIASLGARPDVLRSVSQIDVTNPNDAVLTLDQDTAQLHVGSEQFLERLQAYLGLASALHARVPDIEYVDLRFADRVYVRPALAGHHVTARTDAADRR